MISNPRWLSAGLALGALTWGGCKDHQDTSTAPPASAPALRASNPTLGSSQASGAAVGSARASADATQPAAAGHGGETPNSFLAKGPPTLVVGTASDPHATAWLHKLAEGSLGTNFPAAPRVLDDSFDVTKGPSAWPPNPVLYGGPQANKIIAKLAPTLPFTLAAGKLAFGDHVFTGDGYLVVVLVPARAPDANGPGYPEFLLYAGTGELDTSLPGVNGKSAIHVADAFGTLVEGSWKTGADGKATAELSTPAPRRTWRGVEKQIDGADGKSHAKVTVNFLQQVPPAADDAAVVDTAVRALTMAAKKLAINKPVDTIFYVYPDAKTKGQICGNSGNGEAVPFAHALHVQKFDPSPGGVMEGLIAHEGTHVLAYAAWGPYGSILMGEGLASWAAGKTHGFTLDQWKKKLTKPFPTAELMADSGFRKLPEAEAYAQSALLVGSAIHVVGLDKFSQQLYGASPAAWAAACKSAGTTPQKLDDGLLK